MPLLAGVDRWIVHGSGTLEWSLLPRLLNVDLELSRQAVTQPSEFLDPLVDGSPSIRRQRPAPVDRQIVDASHAAVCVQPVIEASRIPSIQAGKRSIRPLCPVLVVMPA